MLRLKQHHESRSVKRTDGDEDEVESFVWLEKESGASGWLACFRLGRGFKWTDTDIHLAVL